MPTVEAILAEKGPSVLAVSRGTSVIDAAEMMNKHNAGSVLVTNDGQIEGIFTERDVLRRVVAARRDPAATPVSEVMTSEVACCRPGTTMEEARTFMKNKRVRHLPVVDENNKVLGLISIGDLNAYKLDGQETTIHYMREYIYGIV